MTYPEASEEILDCIAVYLPHDGFQSATAPIAGASREELLKQANDACPQGKSLSRIVPAYNPNRSLWEASKGWLPTLEEQRQGGWR